MSRPYVIDTTVVVAGLLTARADAPTARILDAMIAAEFVFLLSDALLTEYRAVLLRPKIRTRHGLSEREVDALLVSIAENAAIREPGAPLILAPDPGDAHLWALLDCEPEAILVTGDKPLLENPPRKGAVCTPAAFVESVLRHPGR
ncbi:MAG TPA: putative toxin-antitoxin system toxin component, PIN family [Longimicrobiales bacterium]|nr:putative toxin-antitoxin system toxin component, PIN family [Longimicrobiales bacterium]